MKLGLEEMLTLLQAMEQDFPWQADDLPFDENALRRLVMADLLERDTQLQQQGVSAEVCQLIYLLSTARLVLDNLALYLRLMRHEPLPQQQLREVQLLMQRLARGEGRGDA
ncbi:hypothetical protein QF022_003174 [Vogesella perlucida]|nr:hypothetical protein [Vogesella perlucida]